LYWSILDDLPTLVLGDGGGGGGGGGKLQEIKKMCSVYLHLNCNPQQVMYENYKAMYEHFNNI
jgi:hypothetical protein